jgi:glyoxylate/succinic semialdehyde reductase
MMRIGFIGLGIMGSRMAAHLQGHADKLVVFNRTPEKAALLLAAGAVWAASPAVLAAQVDVLFTMLAHPDAVREAALGAQGFLGRLLPGALWVDCSTVHPDFAREMAAEARRRHVRFLDAPVAGSRPQAERTELVFLVGGDAADQEQLG